MRKHLLSVVGALQQLDANLHQWCGSGTALVRSPR
jgi:hypothetical protein